MAAHFFALVATPPRAIVYIDGFNFYYRAVKGTRHKWLNLERLCEKLRPDDDVRAVKYFTAWVTGPPQMRQAAFIRALATRPKIEVILGQFKAKTVTCRHPSCTYAGNRRFDTHEEKRTDVNIAITMLDDAYAGACDHMVLVSEDSDLVPAIAMVRQRFPAMKAFVYIPSRPGVIRRADELRRAANHLAPVPTTLFAGCHFPDTIPDGTRTITKPAGW